MESRIVARAVIGAGLALALLAPTGAAAESTRSASSPVVAAAVAAPTTGPDSMPVARLYRAFFLRDADGGGLAYWQSHVRAGLPLSSIASEFARSAEFRARYGSLGDDAFVDLVYRNVMRREPDAGGRAHWTGALRQGLLTRGGVMLSFSDSAEFKRRTGLIGTTSQMSVTSNGPGRSSMVITDRSGRNLSPAAPTLPQRTSYVTLAFPTGADGRPRTGTAMPLHVEGTYRTGSTVHCGGPLPTDHIRACIGFPLMDHAAGINWGDMPNHPGDVGILLDHLLSDPGLAGLVKADRIVYSGSSMGGISGLYFAADGPTHDRRIRAVLSRVGFAPFAIPEMARPLPWKPTPAVLMVNALDDTTIPYELARKTVVAAGPGRVEVVTIRQGGHNPSCPAADHYSGSWLWHHMFGNPVAPTSTLTGCAAAGLLPGGTTGYGAAAPFVR